MLLPKIRTIRLAKNPFILQHNYATSAKPNPAKHITILGQNHPTDDYTNITDKILSQVGTNLHTTPNHPLSHIRQRIVNYFYKSFVNRRGNPKFSVFDNLSPVVSVGQNYDSLLVPQDHPSRAKSDCYYVNRDTLLRAHMTAHQTELMQSGLNNFLMVGDVFRRDEIDRTHYPIFHQLDAVRLRTKEDLFPNDDKLDIFEEGGSTNYVGSKQDKQEVHSLEAVKLMEHELKTTLGGLAKNLFGEQTEIRWVDTTFPFTQPSWELEVFHNNEWMELLGCGIMKNTILTNSGISERIGWAFGVGLERLAMCVYKIPDIRLFWSKDSGFLNQFITENVDKQIMYKPISVYPQCINDLSFWLPENREYCSNDFYDLVRNIGGDLIEQVSLVDNFKHPKSGKTSHCYRIVYRHMEKTLTQAEVNVLHKKIEETVTDSLGVTIR